MDVVPVKWEPVIVIVEPIEPEAGEKLCIVAKADPLLDGGFFLQDKNEKKQNVVIIASNCLILKICFKSLK